VTRRREPELPEPERAVGSERQRAPEWELEPVELLERRVPQALQQVAQQEPGAREQPERPVELRVRQERRWRCR
jgi:hypothetical protein